jgi:hypothetical protein
MPRAKSGTWFEPGPTSGALQDMPPHKPAPLSALRESGPGPNQVPTPGPHEQTTEALEDTLDIDIFSPPREDWLDGSDTYLREPQK